MKIKILLENKKLLNEPYNKKNYASKGKKLLHLPSLCYHQKTSLEKIFKATEIGL